MDLSRIVRPPALLLLPVALSFAAWSIPGGYTYALRGFSERTPVFIGGLLVLVAWYGSCLLAFGLGRRIGGVFPPNSKVVALQGTPRFDKRFYATLTILASVGVGYAIVAAASQVAILHVLTTGGANALNESLGRELGPATLRYTAAISAPVGVYLTIRKRFPRWAAVYNCSLLIVVSAFSNRLLLIMAVVVAAVLFAHDRRPFRLHPTRLLAVGTILYLLLALLNFSRNSGFYNANGVDNVFSMNNYQVASYLGAPAQVSLGVSNALLNGERSMTDSRFSAGGAIVPSFLSPDLPDTLEYAAPKFYGPSVDIAPSLTTNSAFADVIAYYGVLGAGLSLGILLLAGIVWGHAKLYDGLTVTAAGVVAYGLAECWRIFLFTQGVFIYLILAVAMATIVASFGRYESDKSLPRFTPIAGSR